MPLYFTRSVATGFKLKFKKFMGLITTFIEFKREKLVGGGGGSFGSPS